MLYPKKRLGQNFLRDKNILRRIVCAAGIDKDDTVLEIGAGEGGLTELLLEAAGRVVCLDVDRQAVALLAKRFCLRANIDIRRCDFLRYDLGELGSCEKKIKVVGNIPFYITSSIIERIIAWRDKISLAVITVQKEVAQRVVARPPSSAYGRLSCLAQYYARPSVLFGIKGGSFWPRPKVDAAVLRLELVPCPGYPACDEGLLFEIIRAGFGQRRKRLANALCAIASRKAVVEALQGLGLSANARIGELGLNELTTICSRISLAR
ncbi:MAG: 16S rRNA (adenine(1518)-N(6)/adenine(1519)-N(6))-dimethyltransferase RsmA [Candidatus Omnitrophota bacterium]